MNIIFIIGQFCTILINHRILSQINYKTDLPSHWKSIGYELIDQYKIANIACSVDSLENKCFNMLTTWLESDSKPCYCKLFAALETYEYHDLLRKVKEIINP